MLAAFFFGVILGLAIGALAKVAFDKMREEIDEV
jgi:hypothetical protein